MKVLVFGQNGQVARALQRGAPAGFDCTFLSRAEADLSNPQTCADAITARMPDVVINAAAYTNVDGAETEPKTCNVINAIAPAAMAGACAEIDAPFLHLSSDYVFNGSGDAPHQPDARTAPLNAYGRSKLAGETAVRRAHQRHLIVRTSWVFSADGQNFVKTMLRLAETRQALNVVADQIGGPTPARDIATTLFRLAQSMADGAQGGTYHYAGTPALSWADFARAIFLEAGKDVSVTDILTAAYPTPAQRPLNSRLNCATLTADFGIKPPEWQPALQRVIQELGA